MIKYMQTSSFISNYTYTTKTNTLNLNYIKMRRIIMEKIKISVIVPVFNAEKYLKMCLNSLVSQTLKNIEIICIDDGSTDNSLAILDKFKSKDDRIKIIKQKNYGVSMAETTEFLKHKVNILVLLMLTIGLIKIFLKNYIMPLKNIMLILQQPVIIGEERF